MPARDRSPSAVPRGDAARIELRADGRRSRVTVVGDLDMSGRDPLLERVSTAARDGAEVVELDLRRLDSIDSTGLSAVLRADRLVVAAGSRLRVLIGDGGSVRRMFELTLLHLTLDVRTG